MDEKKQQEEPQAIDISAAYPQIAKLKVNQVVRKAEYTKFLQDVVTETRRQLKKEPEKYARQGFHQVDETGLFDKPKAFKAEYLAVIDKQSNLSAEKRRVIKAVGDTAFNRTIYHLIKVEDEKRKTK